MGCPHVVLSSIVLAPQMACRSPIHTRAYINGCCWPIESNLGFSVLAKDTLDDRQSVTTTGAANLESLSLFTFCSTLGLMLPTSNK